LDSGLARIILEDEIKDLGSFFEAYSAGLKASDPLFAADWYRIWVKRLLALQALVVCYPHRLKKSKTLMLECFSDSICAFLLCHFGFYKSADHLMRSSSECLLRAILVEKGFSRDLSKVRDTPNLFRLYRKHASEEVSSDIELLHKNYGALSQSVHTATVAHMTLCLALQVGPKRSTKDFAAKADTASKLLRAYSAILFMDYISVSQFRKIRPHHLQDFFLDGVRPTLKRARQASL
jgi:hypothetical protein